MSIQSIQADLNDAQATLAKLESPNPFWGLSDAEATAKLSRLLLPFDRELSDRYAKLADQAAENARAYKEKQTLQAEEAKTAKELKQMELTARGVLTPEEERRQLRINLDRVREKISNASTTEDKNLYREEEQIYLREQAKESPSTKDAAQAVSTLYLSRNKKPEDGTSELETIQDALDNLKVDIDSGKLQKGSALDKATSDIKTSILKAKLTKYERDGLEGQLGVALSGARTPANPAGDAKGWVDSFVSGLDIKPLGRMARELRNKLVTLANEVKGGNYATANLAPFKEIMGNMAQGEYGIAGDSPLAAAVGELPVVGKSIAGAVAVDKFNSAEDAYTRVNNAIDQYNSMVDSYQPANLIPPDNRTPEREKALADNAGVAALVRAMGSKIPNITMDAKSGKGVDKPTEQKGAIYPVKTPPKGTVIKKTATEVEYWTDDKGTRYAPK